MGHARTRRAVQVRPAGEALEGRELLTGGAGSIFALVQSEVASPGEVASHSFTLDPDHFKGGGRSPVLGVDVAASGGSAVKPRISSVATAKGQAVPITYPRGGVLKAKATPNSTQPKVSNGAVLVPVRIPKPGDRPVTYQTHVLGESKTTGSFLLGYYLPGDTDGDGKVADADVAAIRKAVGSIVGDAEYVFDADANRDGRIGMNDVQTARRNLGLEVTVKPVVSVNLDPVSDSGTQDRVTVFEDVIMTGQGTPGATLQFTQTQGQVPGVTATVGPDGTYVTTLHLSEGKNTFQVTYTDTFGQKITGTIADITYQKPLVPVVSPTKPSTTTLTPAPSPAGITTPDSNTPPKLARLMNRFPDYFQANPDQAEKLRQQMLSKRG